MKEIIILTIWCFTFDVKSQLPQSQYYSDGVSDNQDNVYFPGSRNPRLNLDNRSIFASGTSQNKPKIINENRPTQANPVVTSEYANNLRDYTSNYNTAQNAYQILNNRQPSVTAQQNNYPNTAVNSQSLFTSQQKAYPNKSNNGQSLVNGQKNGYPNGAINGQSITTQQNGYPNGAVNGQSVLTAQQNGVINNGQGVKKPNQEQLNFPNSQGGPLQGTIVQTTKPSPPPDAVAVSITRFGVNMLKTINSLVNGNIVVSPYSVAVSLALLQQGATGDAQLQISRALNISPDKTPNVYKKLSDDLQKRQSGSNILRVATNIFVADAFHLNPAFKRSATQNFASDVTPTNFADVGAAVNKINNWVVFKTNRKIDKLVTPEILSPDSQLVLANAVYFKGIWQTMFKPESTVQQEFILGNGEPTTVSFMRIRRTFKCGYDDDLNAQVVILPFENEQYSLIVVLPAESSDLGTYVSRLTEKKLLDYIWFSTREIELELPKFTVKSETNLNYVLQRMGITSIFGPQSQLSNLGAARNYSPQVSSSLHKAVLSIDEKGGTAAAATSFAVVALSYDDSVEIFKANRPFLTILWDNKLNIPLFMAKIENPNI